MKPPLLILTPHQAWTIARAALAAIGGSDIPILDAAHIRIIDRFDEGETGYVVSVTTTNRYQLHQVTFTAPYAAASGPAEITLPDAALLWIRQHANDYGNDAKIMISVDDGTYAITILKGVHGTERLTRTGAIPKGIYPNVASLVTTAVTAATTPVEIHKYSAPTLRAALAVLDAIANDHTTVTFKQTAQASGRPAGPLLITARTGPDATWQILIQPQGITEGTPA